MDFTRDGAPGRDGAIVHGVNNHGVRPIVSLTAARGLAAWWVVLYHYQIQIAPLLPGALQRFVAAGYLAVDFFFVLSGFVIALNYLESFRQLSASGIGRFLWLRLARIYPLHIVMLVAFLTVPLAIVALSAAKSPGAQFEPGYFALSVVLLQNWGFTDQLGWNVPAWSISTEWAAYLLFPAFAWFAIRRLRRPSAASLAIVVCLAALTLLLWATGHTLGDDIPHLGLPRCLAEFAAGASLYCIWRTQRAAKTAYAGAALIAALLLVVLYVWLPIPDTLVFPAAFVLAVYALATRGFWLTRWLSWRPLVAIGEVSYATYLLHFFVKRWTEFLLVGNGLPDAVGVAFYVVATAAGSVALYWLVEVPGRRRMRDTLTLSRRVAVEPSVT